MIGHHEQNLSIRKEKQEEIDKEPIQLTATQDAFISTIISVITIIVTGICVIIFKEDLLLNNSIIYNTDFRLVLAIMAGFFLFYSYFLLQRTYELSSSTIILPLNQVCSVLTLITTGIIAFGEGTDWIKDWRHLFAYGMLLIGGLLPATKGNIKQAFSLSFWKQRFVVYTLFSELSYGFYEILVSKTEDSEQEAPIIRIIEFLFITRIMFVITFVINVAFNKRMYLEVKTINKVNKFYYCASVLSETLVQIAFFVSIYAYTCYYQVSVVHAAEMSLMQIFNLVLAFSAMKLFKLGKDESMQGIKIKLVSFVLIAYGLSLTSH